MGGMLGQRRGTRSSSARVTATIAAVSYLRRQAIVAALTANALRPPAGPRAGLHAFFAGWIFGELAPQMLALTALDSAAQLRPGRRSQLPTRLGFGLAAASSAGLAHIVRQSQQVRDQVEDALVEGSAWTTSSSSTPYPPRPSSRRRGASWSTPSTSRTVRSRSRRTSRTPSSAAAPCSTSTARRTASSSRRARCCCRSTAARWTIGNKDQQGIPLMQHMAAARLGVRGDQLPPRPARPLPGARDRREAVDRVDQGAHRRLRRQPRLHRHHRRIGGRPPVRAGRGHAERQGVAAGLRGRRHQRPGRGPALRRLRPRRLDRPAQRDGHARRVPRARRSSRSAGTRTPRPSRPPRPSCASTATSPTSSSSTAPTTPWSTSARPARSWRSCAGSRRSRSCTPSCPAPSTRSTSSRRSARRTSCAASSATSAGTGTRWRAGLPVDHEVDEARSHALVTER